MKKIIRRKTDGDELEVDQPVEQNYQYMQQSSRPQSNNLVVILLVVISFFAGYLFFKVKNLEQNKNTAAAAPNQQNQQAQPPPPTTVSLDAVKKLFSDGYLKFGDANRKALFVEVSDPSCPFCHIAGGKNPELSKQVGAQFQYKTDGGSYVPPLPEMRKLVDQGKASYVMIFGNGHGNGRLATEAMYCAYEKGKFWEVHDELMNNKGYDLLNNTVKNDKANIPALVNYLSSSIDSNFLTKCLQDGKYTDKIARDEQLIPQLGFQGTPHFIINTTIFGGAQNYSQMESAVKSALES